VLREGKDIIFPEVSISLVLIPTRSFEKRKKEINTIEKVDSLLLLF
jgi:hypothetical protein